jgi:hypothetical protein
VTDEVGPFLPFDQKMLHSSAARNFGHSLQAHNNADRMVG